MVCNLLLCTDHVCWSRISLSSYSSFQLLHKSPRDLLVFKSIPIICLLNSIQFSSSHYFGTYVAMYIVGCSCLKAVLVGCYATNGMGTLTEFDRVQLPTVTSRVELRLCCILYILFCAVASFIVCVLLLILFLFSSHGVCWTSSQMSVDLL